MEAVTRDEVEAAAVRIKGAVRRTPVLELEPDFVFGGWESNFSADGAGERDELAALGIRTYVGARLTDSTGLVLGTICIVDRDPHQWGQAGLDLIKDHAANLNQWISDRESLAADPETRPG